MRHDFRVIQGCPCPKNLAPYFAVVVSEAQVQVTSIYRGEDAEAILHAHGKHSQADLYAGWVKRLPGFLPANPPGYSTHEQFSDGVAYPQVPRGRRLAWWQIGIDVNGGTEAGRCIQIADRHGWRLFHPYRTGAEIHHLNFARRPYPHTPAMALRIVRLRRTLPRH